MKLKETKVTRENLCWLLESPIEIKMELLHSHLTVCQLIINQILEESQNHLAGARYDRNKPYQGRYSRWGYNDGSVRIGDEKIGVKVPRLIDNQDESTFNAPGYREIQDNRAGEERIMKGMLKGLSSRNYQGVIDLAGEAFGMSKSAISKRFVEHTSQALEEFHARKFANRLFVGMLIDGIELGGEMMIVAMGITHLGEKVVLDFVHTATENHRPIKVMLQRIRERGFKVNSGFLVVIDGSKGIHKAVTETFPKQAIIQRCVWHKYKNVISYLPEKHHQWFKENYYDALESGTYQMAKALINKLASQLKSINESAAKSLLEGIEELLSLHKIATVKKDPKIIKYLRISLATTNCIENLNSGLRRHFIRVDRWTNSNQRNRWLAAAVMELEPRLKKIKHFKKLVDLNEGIQLYLKPLIRKQLLST
jgi:transposase-like protein